VRRRLFNIASAVSLVLFAMAIVSVRSYINFAVYPRIDCGLVIFGVRIRTSDEISTAGLDLINFTLLALPIIWATMRANAWFNAWLRRNTNRRGFEVLMPSDQQKLD